MNWREETLRRLDEGVALRRMTRAERLRRRPVRTLYNAARIRLAAALCARLGRGFTRRVPTIFGEDLTVTIPPYGDLLAYGAELGSDAEVRLTRFLLRELREGDTVFDVGANIGYYTLLASRAAGPTGRVAAFEPAPPILEFLRVNAGGLGNVRIVDKALSDADGATTLFLPPFPWVGIASLLPDWQDHGGTRTEVRTVRLDAFCAAEGLAPRVIKVDVEGAEDRVIAGGREFLKTRSPTLTVEVLFNPVRESHRRAIADLRALGYRPWAIEDDGDLRALDFDGLDAYFRELKARYDAVQDSVNDFDNLVFRKP